MACKTKSETIEEFIFIDWNIIDRNYTWFKQNQTYQLGDVNYATNTIYQIIISSIDLLIQFEESKQDKGNLCYVFEWLCFSIYLIV